MRTIKVMPKDVEITLAIMVKEIGYVLDVLENSTLHAKKVSQEALDFVNDEFLKEWRELEEEFKGKD